MSEAQFALFSAAADQPKTKRRGRPFQLKPCKPKIKENHVEAAVLTFLRVRGWRVDRQHVGKAQWPSGEWLQLHPEGTADWFAHRPATSPSCLYIETKAPGERPTEQQMLYLEMAARAGYLTIWCDSLQAFVDFYGRYFPSEI